MCHHPKVLNFMFADCKLQLEAKSEYDKKHKIKPKNVHDRNGAITSYPYETLKALIKATNATSTSPLSLC